MRGLRQARSAFFVVALLAPSAALPAGLFRKGSFFAAVAQGDAKTVRARLSKNPKLANIPAGQGDLAEGSLLWPGETPLSVAVRAGRASTAQLLLDKGADPDGLSRSGARAIHYALGDPERAWNPSNEARRKCLRLLLAAGANPDLADRSGWAPLHWAVDALAPASSIELLLNNGATPDELAEVHGIANTSPLHFVMERAAASPQAVEWAVEVARLLVEFGAKADLRRADGQTPESLAIGLDPRLQSALRSIVRRSPVPIEASAMPPSDLGAWAGRVVSKTTPLLNEKLVALTFDDGPNSKNTPLVLALLAKYRARATFFCLGGMAASHPALVKRIVEEGHALGNHSVNHPMGAIPAKRLPHELDDAKKAIEALSGQTVDLFRPPGGNLQNGLVARAIDEDQTIVMWTIDPQDWRASASASRIAQLVTKQAKPGSIVLLHDGGGRRSETVRALETILRQLGKAGFRFVTVPELLEASVPPKPKSSP